MYQGVAKQFTRHSHASSSSICLRLLFVAVLLQLWDPALSDILADNQERADLRHDAGRRSPHLNRGHKEYDDHHISERLRARQQYQAQQKTQATRVKRRNLFRNWEEWNQQNFNVHHGRPSKKTTDRNLLYFPLTDYRSIDGSDRDDGWGAAETPLTRLTESTSYVDNKGIMADGVNPRTISNTVCAQGEDLIFNELGHSDMVWAWGQFLDHDISLTEKSDSFGMKDIEIPHDESDLFTQSGCKLMEFSRSEWIDEPRQQLNLITAFIDASNVYGSDEVRANALRTHEDGKLNTTDEGLSLPYNEEGLMNAGGRGKEFYLAGDNRANEHAGLTSMHTLFVREHNRLAGLIRDKFNGATDEDIYQLARKLVGAEMQIITYEEYLPALLGPEAPDLSDHHGFDKTVDPRISNEFSTIIYRYGHSMVTGTFLLADEHGMTGCVALRDIFFNPKFFTTRDSSPAVDRLIGGFFRNTAQKIDTKVVDDLRNHLFANTTESESECLDLVALNIQRGRDHGLHPYNKIREALGLEPNERFEQITSDPKLQRALRIAYGSTSNIDGWVGALAEDHVYGAGVGEMLTKVMKDQFIRLAKGDPYFYLQDQDLWNPVLKEILDLENLTLAEVIRQNTIHKNLHSDTNVFYATRPELENMGFAISWD